MLLSSDPKAIQLGQCAQELKKEIVNACAEFSYLRVVSQDAKDLIDDESKFLFYRYRTKLGGMIGNYLIKPLFQIRLTQDEYDTLFGNSHIHHEASSIMGMTLNQKLFDPEGNLRVDVLESFITGLETYLVRYFVAIKQTPSIFLNYHELDLHKRNAIQKIAEKLNIALDGDKGILPHLFQHLMRIPLLLKSMHTLAEESKLLQIKEFGPRLCELHSEISRLLVQINKASPKVKY